MSRVCPHTVGELRCVRKAMDARRGVPPTVICGQATQRRRHAVLTQPFGKGLPGRMAALVVSCLERPNGAPPALPCAQASSFAAVA